MPTKCHQCIADIQFKESQVKEDAKVILDILKNISGSKDLLGSHAHNLLEIVTDDNANNLTMPPLCVKCGLTGYDELNRQLTELEMEGIAYEEEFRRIQDLASTSPYDPSSNKAQIDEYDDEIEKLENELKLMEFEEAQLQWETQDLIKEEEKTCKEYDGLSRQRKKGQRSLITKQEALHSLNNQNEYYLSQIKRLKSPELMKTVIGCLKKPVMDASDKLVA